MSTTTKATTQECSNTTASIANFVLPSTFGNLRHSSADDCPSAAGQKTHHFARRLPTPSCVAPPCPRCASRCVRSTCLAWRALRSREGAGQVGGRVASFITPGIMTAAAFAPHLPTRAANPARADVCYCGLFPLLSCASPHMPNSAQNWPKLLENAKKVRQMLSSSSNDP